MAHSYKKEWGKPVENHKTAAWASIEQVKEVSRVPKPSEEQVRYAKDYVDENQK